MTHYSFGAVALVPFPFTDQSAVKKRPAVVVSSRRYNEVRPGPGDHGSYQPTALDGLILQGWQVAGLLKPSAIKPVFATIAEPLVLRSLGVLTASDRQALVGWIKRLLG